MGRYGRGAAQHAGRGPRLLTLTLTLTLLLTLALALPLALTLTVCCAGEDPSSKAIVFSQFVSMLDLIEHRLQKAGVRWPYSPGE